MNLLVLPFFSSKGTSTNEQSTPESALRRPSLACRLLGKRKASAPAEEQPGPKRLTTEAPGERSGHVETEASAPAEEQPDPKSSAVKQEQTGDVESPTTSSSDSFADTPAPSASPEVSQEPQPKPSEDEDEAPVRLKSVQLETSDAVCDISGQQSIEVISLCDSDSLDEVIISDASPAAAPSGETPASPASADGSAAKSPGPPVSRSPFIHLASTSGPPVDFGSLSGSESKSAGPVPCHYCPNAVYQPAIKTCLVCGASMCSEHLRPHLESPVFQNHTLIAPVEDISSWKCQEHQDINRIYCRKCGVCVCALCPLVGSHQNHECISLREAERQLRVSAEASLQTHATRYI